MHHGRRQGKPHLVSRYWKRSQNMWLVFLLCLAVRQGNKLIIKRYLFEMQSCDLKPISVIIIEVPLLSIEILRDSRKSEKSMLVAYSAPWFRYLLFDCSISCGRLFTTTLPWEVKPAWLIGSLWDSPKTYQRPKMYIWLSACPLVLAIIRSIR